MTRDEVEKYYESLRTNEMHPTRRKGLEIIHKICCERYESKARSWTMASIGRASRERGGPTEGSLRNPRLEVYRLLVKAWESASQPTDPREENKGGRSVDWIEGIDDLNRRQLVYMMQRDLQRSEAEVRRLKKLLPEGGHLKVHELATMNATSTLDPSPSQIRAVRRFCDYFLGRPDVLREKSLILKRDELLDTDTGEVIAERPAIEVMRLLARLADSEKV